MGLQITGALVIRHVNLIDGTGSGPSQDMGIVVTGERISEVRPEPLPRDSFPADAEILDGRGLTLMPGLIDAHQHLGGWEAPPTAWLKNLSSYEAIRAAVNAGRTLQAGITTVRDSGSFEFMDVAVARAVRENLILGPRVIPSGYYILAAGSGEDGFLRQEVTLRRDYGVVTGPIEARRAVREMLYMGAEAIKVVMTGRVGADGTRQPTDPELSFDEVESAVIEAHRRGVKVDSHCMGVEGTRDAVRAGVDCVTHGWFLDDAIIDEMVARGTTLIPTLGILKRLSENEKNLPSEIVRRVRLASHAHLTSFPRALQAGVTMAMGSDGCNSYMPAGTAAFELQCLVKAGMTPLGAIVAATRNGAAAVGMADDIGTIEASKRADLILVAGDPTKDIAILMDSARIKVIRGGKVLNQRPGPISLGDPTRSVGIP